ncbi:MAG: hypothetical protein JXQ99_22610 [Hyphomicrobiaceae bacterium]
MTAPQSVEQECPTVLSAGSTYLGDVFETKVRELEDAGKWRKAGASGRFDATPQNADTLLAQVFAFEVLQSI